MPRRSIALEVTCVFVGVCGVTGAVSALPASLREYGSLALAAAFLFTATTLAARLPGGAREAGIDLGGLLSPAEEDPDAGSLRELLRTLRRGLPAAARELGWALGVVAVLFPPYGVAYALWHGTGTPLVWAPPADLLDFVLGQLVVVALPEEALFRGYFQTRLTQLWPTRRRVLGCELSPPAWGLQALLFGAVHVFTGGVTRLSTAAPGLLFGWLRAKRGGIGAAVFLHALSNVFAELLARGLR